MTHPSTNIILIGMMGSGKSAVGKQLAKTLHKNFIDLDRIIEKRERKRIPTLFKTHGILHFRSCEAKALQSIKKVKNSVIATGGGTILLEINRRLLKKMGVVIWLKTSTNVLLNRIQNSKQRPLLNKLNINLGKGTLLRKILLFRKPLYQSTVDIIIDTSYRSIQDVVKIIQRTMS